MDIPNNLKTILKELETTNTTLVAVSKTHPPELIMEAYNAGQRIFGENKVQEMTAKYETLPKDIQWHLIGHLQTNKVSDIAPFVTLIHSVDSLKLLQVINKEAEKNNLIIDCLLQVFIATEESKFGLSFDEAIAILKSNEARLSKNIRITGLMGMATFTDDTAIIRNEFKSLKQFYDSLKNEHNFSILSMGMSSDYRIAIEEGSNMVRIGSAIFGERSNL